jgi:hypothetical protein
MSNVRIDRIESAGIFLKFRFSYRPNNDDSKPSGLVVLYVFMTHCEIEYKFYLETWKYLNDVDFYVMDLLYETSVRYEEIKDPYVRGCLETKKDFVVQDLNNLFNNYTSPLSEQVYYDSNHPVNTLVPEFAAVAHHFWDSHNKSTISEVMNK